jgi:hypothetical protein
VNTLAKRGGDLLSDALPVLMLAAGVFVVWQLWKGLSGLGQAAGAAAQSTASGIASLWVSLTSGPSMGGVLGNVVFPDGRMSPLAGYAVRTDAQGNVYINTGGTVYQLQPSDAQGNWPAVLVG